MLKKTAVAATAALLPLAMAAPASAAESTTVQLAELNGSGATGTAEMTLDGSMLTVAIESAGLAPGLPHAQHLHVGGNNVCPTMDVAGEDGVLSVAEGAPAYGGIALSLTTSGDFGADSGLAVDRMPVATDAGAVSYERTFDLSQVDGEFALDDVVVVQHGIDTISPNGQYGPPPPVSSIDPSLPLEATAPANCGAVVNVSGTNAPAPADAPAADAPAPAAGAPQVEQTPSGGVATGAGGTTGVENAGLITLGALGLLGAGAVAVRRRAVLTSR